MTLEQRAAAFAATFRDWPAAHLHLVEEQGHQVLYGRWLIGNDYRNRSALYGSYPNGYLARVMALFPDVAHETSWIAQTPDAAWPLLHVFSGSLPPGEYVRLDIRQEPIAGVHPDIIGSVYDLPTLSRRGGILVSEAPFALVLADPPYSVADAKKYGTSSVDRRRALAALADSVKVGGHLVWLDTCWPMHRKAQWRTVGRIALTRATNHRSRDITIFERIAA